MHNVTQFDKKQNIQDLDILIALHNLIYLLIDSVGIFFLIFSYYYISFFLFQQGLHELVLKIC